MMLETKAVNEALGVRIPADMMERRLGAAGSVVGHKMSMLQDVERGRSLEIDALVTAVRGLGAIRRPDSGCRCGAGAGPGARRAFSLYAPIGISC